VAASDEPSETTRILRDLTAGDPEATGRLLPLVYQELRGLAGRKLGGRGAGQTLQPTALVHEVFLKLFDIDEVSAFEGRSHFFAVAAKVMRQILVDHARRRGALKRGGDRERVTMSDVGMDSSHGIDVLDLEAALTKFTELTPRPARVAELRFFAGLDIKEVAEALSVSERTVKNDWVFARAWLRRALSEGDGD